MVPSTLYPWLLIGIASYLAGSLPSGFLAGRMCGIDLRTQGSGNIGATNALRVLGKGWGYSVFLIDFLKGLLPVVLASSWGAHHDVCPPTLPGAVAGISLLLGHSFPVWLGFKGGKGIASSAGVIVGLFGVGAFLFCLGSWLLVFTATRYVSVASIAASLALPAVVTILFLLHHMDWLGLTIAVVMCALAIWQHRANLARLGAGTEPRFERKKR